MIEEDVEVRGAVLQQEWTLLRGVRRGDLAAGEVLDDLGHGVAIHRTTERRHAAIALLDHLRQLHRRASLGDVHQRRTTGPALPVVTMAARAVGSVQRLVTAWHELQQPCHLVGIHIQQPGPGIEGWPSPFTAPIDTGEDDRALGDVRRLVGMRRVVLIEGLQRSRMRRRGALREIVTCERLARECRRHRRKTLRGGRTLAVERQGRHRLLRHGKHRRAALTLEQPHMSRLGDLRHRIHRLALALHRDEHRRRRQIPIPEIVLQHLVVPPVLAGACIERDDAVGVQVVADAIGAVEVVRCRTRCREQHPALRIHGHTGPGVGAAGDLPCIGRPRLVPRLPRVRDGVKTPAQLPGLQVECADVTRCAGQLLGDRAAHDQHVLEHDARCAGADGNFLRRTAKSLAQVHPATVVAPARHPRTRPAIECEKLVAIVEDDAIAGDDHATVAETRRGWLPVVRIIDPQLLAGHRVEREDVHFRGGGVQHAVDDDRIGLHLGPLELALRLERPRDLELRDVGRRDLTQRGVVRVIGVATVHRPVGVACP